MKERYKIVGTHRIGNKVRLFLKFDSLIKEKEDSGGIMNMLKMGANMEQFQAEMQERALLAQQPDVITIPYDEWQKYQYKVDDVVWIEVSSDKKEI